ncbi:hypothetical protein CRG98_030180 [Punica granatum]|uniref:G-patch domain-containing protein n=1 Tax=Punica granatum TaxID=22663 RepID=A0A2I0IZM0_PUNGR|nr:hypothetical protein CRG98_030180 [Punica granatum]
MALIRNLNRISSSSTLLLGQGPTVDPIPWAPPTQAPENDDTHGPPMMHTPAAHPVNASLLSPPTPTNGPGHVCTATSIHAGQFDGTGSRLVHDVKSRRHSYVGGPLPKIHRLVPVLCRDASELLELSTKEMAEGQEFEYYATKWRALAAKHLLKHMLRLLPIAKSSPSQPHRLHFHCRHHNKSSTTPLCPLKLNNTSLRLRELLSRHNDPRPYRVNKAGRLNHSSADSFHPYWSPPHIYRQLLAGVKIRPEALGPNFNLTNQNPNLRCEYHLGAPGHSHDNCWKLQQKIQEMIEKNEISFNVVKPPNVQANPLLNHGSSSGPTINVISICAIGEEEGKKEDHVPFVIEYVLEEATIGFTGSGALPTPSVIEVLAREPYQDSRVPWTYEGSVGNLEQQMSVMGMTCSGLVYKNPKATNKGKTPTVALEAASQAAPIPAKKVTEEEAKAFMKVIKASEYQVVEQMGKSLAHISLLALLLSSEEHQEALLKVLTAAQVPKEMAPSQIEETISTIFSNAISFFYDEFPSEGYGFHGHCTSSAISTLKQINVHFNRIRPSKTAVRAFDGSQREVNGEIDLLIDIGPCLLSVTFQRLKFIVEDRIITVKGEEDYVINKETVVPYISIEDDQNLPFHSFETISVIKDYGEVSPSQADLMVGKFMLQHNYIPGIGLRANGQGITHPIEIEEYKNRRGLSFHLLAMRLSKHTRVVTSTNSQHTTGRINRGIPVPPLSHFFSGPPSIVGGTLDGPYSDSKGAPVSAPDIYAVTQETPQGVYLRPTQENEELNNWISVSCYSAVVADVEGFNKSCRVPEIKESLQRLEYHQLTSVEPIEEINVGTEEKPHTLKIGTGLDPTQRARMIYFLEEYQEVFAWSYVDMPGLDSSIHLRWQQADLLLCIKEEVVKQINVGFLEVCNYSEWVANIVPVEKKDGRVRVCVDYRDLNMASPKDNFPLPNIDVLVDNTAHYTQFSFMDVFSRAMVTLFHDIMHKEIEAYIDDMIAKSREGEDRLVNLKRLFDRLKKYKLRLNLAKCIFRAKSGKLLGFVVSERGIEVDLDKVKAIMELPPPSIVCEVRSFLGQLNYIARFIANLTDKCQPLFRLLHKNATIEWDDKCQKAFDTVKAYLVQPPVLVPLTLSRPLILYLTLTKYDIEYIFRTSVKWQGIADHLVEFPIEDNNPINSDFLDEGILQVDDEEDRPAWKMYFDGSVNSTGSGIGVVLISHDGRYYPDTAKIDFPCTNNVAEYEACILGLQVAIGFKTKDEKLVSYPEYLEELAENFEMISFTYTPRIKNQFADMLATLASTASIKKENLIEPLEIEIAKGPAHYDAIEATNATSDGCCTDPNVLSSEPVCARPNSAAWECPPSRGCVMDTREKESPPTILRPASRVLVSYPGLGVNDTSSFAKVLVVEEPKNPSSGVHVTCGPISCMPFRYCSLLGLLFCLFTMWIRMRSAYTF